MKHYFLLLCALGLILLTTAPVQAQVVLGYKTALKKAKNENKPIMIQFKAGWCKYCDQMTQEFRSDALVKQTLKQKFVWVQIDQKKDAELTKKFSIYDYPQLLFLKSDGKKIGSITGYQDPQAMQKLLQFVSTKAYVKRSNP